MMISRNPINKQMEDHNWIEEELMECLDTTDYERAKEILEQQPEIDVNKVKNEATGWNPLTCTARDGKFDFTVYLVEVRKAEVNSKDKWGLTPLMWASGDGHLRTCQFLAAKGAALDINVQDSYGKTAFMYAAMNGRLDVCRLLYENGARLSIHDNYGSTSIMLAALGGFLNVCKFLTERGVDLNTSDAEGNTALFNAARLNQSVVCVYLLENGANVNKGGGNEKTALMCLGEYGNYDLVKLLCFYGAVMPMNIGFNFRHTVGPDVRDKITSYVVRHPLRQIMIRLVSSATERKRVGKRRSIIMMLNVDLLRKLFIMLGGEDDLLR
jgi:ankyrin repeat protein